tara:strand:- start:5 stop:127 length:123 start_codon:yes stop_codon:yes gene_type:complete
MGEPKTANINNISYVIKNKDDIIQKTLDLVRPEGVEPSTF